MNPALALNFYSDHGCSKTMPGTGMPCEIGANLFKSLLIKENRVGNETKKDRINPKPNGRGFGAARVKNNRGHEKKTAPGADDFSILAESGLPVSLLKMDPQSASKLITFLQSHGLSREKASALVKTATDKEGFIHVDLLMAGLGDFSGTAPGKKKELVIAERDVPQLQKVLFEMGLGVGEVKALSEQSDDGKGNMVLSKLVAGLGRRFPDMDAQEKLVFFLARLGIGCRSDDAEGQVSISDLKPFMQVYAGTSSEDVQKHIKTVLAQLLQEKDVPPEKVKSFLEGINVTYAKNVSWNEPAEAGDLGVWDGLVLRQQHKVKNDPWTEKILAILKDARTGAQKAGSEKGNFFQSKLPRVEDQVTPGSKSASERLASLLHAGEEGYHSRRQRDLGGNGFDGKISAASENMFVKAADPGSWADRVFHRSPHAAVFARSLEHTQDAAPIPAILDRMQWMLDAGKQKARIQLSPPELGHLDLRLVIDQGHLQAHLGTENLLVKEMIESNLGQLKQQLEGLGFVVDEFNVHVGADGRDCMDQGEAWGGAEKTGDSGWAGKKDIEPADLGAPDARRGEDDRYQINVRV